MQVCKNNLQQNMVSAPPTHSQVVDNPVEVVPRLKPLLSYMGFKQFHQRAQVPLVAHNRYQVCETGI